MWAAGPGLSYVISRMLVRPSEMTALTTLPQPVISVRCVSRRASATPGHPPPALPVSQDEAIRGSVRTPLISAARWTGRGTGPVQPEVTRMNARRFAPVLSLPPAASFPSCGNAR